MWKRFVTAGFSKKVGKAEWVALALYFLGIAVISACHEPWFEEAQAWQIARSATIREMFFYVPRYEGHPPLWYLILAIFAKNGAPYELTLKAVNVLFCTGAMAVLLLRSPFPKVIRCLLPFTFFSFYQFGVISRPYGVFMLAMMLTAAGYTKRNAHPWKYILPLCLLCLSTAFGILLAGGLCIVWTVEILAEKSKDKTLRRFWLDKRFWPLCLILLLAVLLFLILISAEDVYYDGITQDVFSRFKSQYAYVMMIPFDSFAGNYLTLSSINRTLPGLIIDAAGGAVCWVLLISVAAKNRKLWEFLLPYGFFTMFMLFKFSSYHHIGISTWFIIFYFWIILERPEGFALPGYLKRMVDGIESPLLKKIGAGVMAFVFLVPVFHSITSAVNEVRYDYGPVKVAEFIKDNHLEDRKIMVQWYYDNKISESKEETLYATHYMPAPHAEIETHYPLVIGLAAALLPYFDDNIFMNFNNDYPDHLFMHYAYAPDDEAVFAEWRAQGLPDFILDYCPIDEVYDAETLRGVTYLCIAEFPIGKPYKFTLSETSERVYIREDLLDEYPQFEPIYTVVK